MLNAEQTSACAHYVLDKTRHVIDSFGPRPPGSEAEAKTQQLVAQELEAVCDGEVKVEPFLVAPKAFMGMQRVAGLLAIVATVYYWFSAHGAVLFSGTAILILFFQLVRYRQLLDIFARKSTSFNVSAVQKPTGEVKRRIILNAHPDAAYEWRFNYSVPKLFPWLTRFSVIALIGKFLTDAAFLLLGGGWEGGYTGLWLYVGIFQLCLIPGALVGVFFTNFNHVSPGANDNLSGTFIVTGIAKFLREAGVRLANTEIIFCITGSEEAGLRGAKAYVAAHGEELRDGKTVAIALDTFRDLEHLYVYNRDLNGTVKHDARVCKMLQDAGKDCGLDLAYASIFLGSSDGTAFTQGGIPAGALCAMDPAPADWYHNRRDDYDNMDAVCVQKAIEVVLATLKRYDETGLPQV